MTITRFCSYLKMIRCRSALSYRALERSICRNVHDVKALRNYIKTAELFLFIVLLIFMTISHFYHARRKNARQHQKALCKIKVIKRVLTRRIQTGISYVLCRFKRGGNTLRQCSEWILDLRSVKRSEKKRRRTCTTQAGH